VFKINHTKFLELIYSNIPRRAGDERMLWKLKAGGVFTVDSYYEDIQGASPNSFPWRSIWCTKAPKRVSFFDRTAVRGS